MKLALVAAVLCVACSPRPDHDSRKGPPPALIVPAPEVSPFFMRQKLDVETRGQKRTIDTVVQYDARTVTTAFLSAAGRPFVTMVQRGDEADISGPGVAFIPFDLRWVMQEIGVALLLSPISGTTLDGPNERQSAVGLVQESWIAGRLQRRAIRDTETIIEYGWTDGACPQSITITNQPRDYRLVITTSQCTVEP